MNVKNAITSYEEKIEKLQVEIEEGYKIIGRKKKGFVRMLKSSMN